MNSSRTYRAALLALTGLIVVFSVLVVLALAGGHAAAHERGEHEVLNVRAPR